MAKPGNCPSYELYGVCNHTGTLTGGHYTALCRNPYSQRYVRFPGTEIKVIGI